MGLSISLVSLTWIEVIRKNIVGLETITLFKSSGINPENAASNDSSKEIQKKALGCKSLEIEKNPKLEDENPMTELHEAAVKLQKVYKSYRTRRNLADCAVVVEELWWKALDFASLRRSSISFFHDEKPETAVSRWARARTMAAKVGKGLSKSDKAKKLALQHWLEAIDPRHRYGHNLHFYYDVWFKSESAQPFFYWFDIGDGREVNLHKIYSFSSPIFALKLVQLSRYPSCNQSEPVQEPPNKNMTSSARVQKPAWFFLLLLIIFFPSEIMECASLASPRQPLTQVQAQAHANMEKEVFEEEMKMRVGSRPPNCENKCGGCEPCMAIQVPTSVDRMRPQYANYEPEGWKCKCGSTFYNP